MADKKQRKRRINRSDFAAVKWMVSIGKSQVYKVVIIVLANAVAAGLSICYANFSKHIINGATEYHDMKYVVRYAVYLLILILVQMSLNLVSSSFSERCRGRLDMLFKRHILDTIMKKDYSAITAFHSGDLNNRLFNDITIITDGFTSIIPNTVLYTVKLLCAFIYLVVIDKVFAIVFLVGGVFVFLCTRAFRSTLKRLHKDVQRTEGKTRSFIQETLSNLLVIRTFVAEKKVDDKTDELQQENYKARMKRRFFSISANAGLSVTFNFGYVFALAFGAFRLIGGLDYGTVTAMLQLVNQIQGPFASLSSIMPKYYSLIASAERLMELEEIPDEITVNDSNIDAKSVYGSLDKIRFDNISFKYNRDAVLTDTSLDIKKGDFVAIMGISGIGKSTLLKLLLGVYPVGSGSIYLDCGDKTIPVDGNTRKLFAYVPQGNMLLSGTIRDNLLFINSDVTDDEIKRAIEISCSDDFIKDLPDGLDTVIGENGMGLSEGQIQRLAIARSLLSDAPILLLDEATSALDEATELRFLKNLHDMKNKTCIIVSHKSASLQICNKHIQIVNQKIVSEGE